MECYHQRSHLEAPHPFPFTWTLTKANAILNFVRKDSNRKDKSIADGVWDAVSKHGTIPRLRLACGPFCPASSLSCVFLGPSDALVTFCFRAVISGFGWCLQSTEFLDIPFLVTCSTAAHPWSDSHLLLTPLLDLLISFPVSIQAENTLDKYLVFTAFTWLVLFACLFFLLLLFFSFLFLYGSYLKPPGRVEIVYFVSKGNSFSLIITRYSTLNLFIPHRLGLQLTCYYSLFVSD